MSDVAVFPADKTLAQKIGVAATRLFQVRGYEAVTIDDIVAEVGATKGSFYYYFKSKAQLLLWLHEEYVEFSVGRFRDAFAQAGPNPRHQLEAFVYESFRQIHHHQEYVGLLFDERRSLPEGQTEGVKARKAHLRAMLADIIKAGSQEGVFRPVDSHATAMAIFGMCTWGYMWYEPQGRLSWEELAAQFAEIAWRGLAAEAPDEPDVPSPRKSAKRRQKAAAEASNASNERRMSGRRR